MFIINRSRRRELGFLRRVISELDKYEDWDKLPPAPGTWIAFKYKLSDSTQIGKLCNTGCCVSMSGYSVILPNYWRFATQAEIDAEIKKDAQVRKLSTEDLWDFFS